MPNPYSGLGPDDFAEALLNLFPRGPAWPRDPNSTQGLWRAAVAQIQADFHADASNFFDVELDPFFTSEFLPDWETEYGLPDPCLAGAAQTLDERHDALIARIADAGGLNPARYIALAASIGETVTVTEFLPFRAGQGTAGSPAYGQSWIFAWQINASLVGGIQYFTVNSPCTDPLEQWGNSELACLMNSRNRGSRTLLIAYS